MRLLNLYEKVLAWCNHPSALRYLAFVSFLDASVFPVSPNFMLIPMSYAKPTRAFWFASICVFWSVLGGFLGYFIGYFALDALEPYIRVFGYWTYYQAAMEWFKNWGFWAIFLAGFSPFIPYKIFTISAGVLQLNLFGFLIASLLGRTVRFFLIAWIIRLGGPKVEYYLRRFLTKNTPENNVQQEK